MSLQDPPVRIHGHRGYRALLPENCLQGFLYAASLGVDALELDVVITRDDQILVSHDPFMHHEISSAPDGRRIREEEEKTHNIWKMYSDQVQRYPMGKFRHPRFPGQLTQKGYKPLLREVVQNLPQPRPLLNIEVKSQPQWYGEFQPEPEVYAEKFILCMERLNLSEALYIQSFDPNFLRALHDRRKDLPLVFLTEKAGIGLGDAEELLGFKPKGFSPHFSLINEHLVKECAAAEIELLTWTVNDEKELSRLHSMGVRQFITDEVEMALRWKRRLSQA
jgi:glycerophosphoryl diester phosphodiesterase